MQQTCGDEHDAEILSETASPLRSLLWKEGPLSCPHQHSQAYQLSNTSLLSTYSDRLPREDLRMSESRYRLSCACAWRSMHFYSVSWQDLILRSRGLRNLFPCWLSAGVTLELPTDPIGGPHIGILGASAWYSTVLLLGEWLASFPRLKTHNGGADLCPWDKASPHCRPPIAIWKHSHLFGRLQGHTWTTELQFLTCSCRCPFVLVFPFF